MQPAVSFQRTLLVAIAMLSFAGIVISLISLQRHYAKSATTYCDFNQQFSCDIVNRSEYSSIAGIPVAAIGVAGYVALFLLSTRCRSRPGLSNWLLGASIAGLIFALYLTYIEAYVLTTWCILCLISLALIFLVTVAAAVLKMKGRRLRSHPTKIA